MRQRHESKTNQEWGYVEMIGCASSYASQNPIFTTFSESPGDVLKKCVNSQAVYPLSGQHGLEAQERRYTAHEEGKH